MNIEDLPVLNDEGSKVGPFDVVDRAEIILVSGESRIAYVLGKSKGESGVLFLTDLTRVREGDGKKITLYVDDGEYYVISSARIIRYSSLKMSEP